VDAVGVAIVNPREPRAPPLSQPQRAVCLSRVRPTSTRAGLALGLLAASATAGALVGFGHRLGIPSRPFNAIARLLLGSRAEGVWGFAPLVTLTGVALHVTTMLVWGVVYVRLAAAHRGGARIAIAVGVAAMALLVELLVVERVLHAGVSGVLSPMQVVVVHAVLAVALAVGMRFALPPL